MYNRVASKLTAKYHPETLRHIGTQLEALISQHSSLLIHKRAIERQLSSIAASIKEQVLVLIPRNVFLLLEMRGSGGVSNQLEQITHIVREEGYWIPRVRVQNYYRQDVYRLGKSVQRLFDDFAVLHQRVEQFNARLWHIKKCQQMEPEMTPQEVFERLAASTDISPAQHEVDAIVELLEQANRRSRSWWFQMSC